MRLGSLTVLNSGGDMELIYNHRISKVREASRKLDLLATFTKDDKTRNELKVYSWVALWAWAALLEYGSVTEPSKKAIEAKAKEMCDADPNNPASVSKSGKFWEWTKYEKEAKELLTQEIEDQGLADDTKFHSFLAVITSRKYEDYHPSSSTEESVADNTPRITMVDGGIDIVNYAVDHPKHYLSHPSGIECIEIVRHENFNIGNAMKYIWRRNDKGNPGQDLKKAMWYLQDEINRLQKQQKE